MHILVRSLGLIVALSAFAAPASLPAQAQDAPDQAMIVLDGSGSMWGQINGEAKISIARRVLSEVLSTSPRGLYLGLMAYGHRRKGQCDDIEVLIAPAPGATAEIAGMAKDINPKGKTPLTEAVRQAANALKYTEERATVIVITDGLETCNADPCALGRSLEQSGIDFTAHIVGFGLSAAEGRQVACLAENTGGRYFPAQDARALGEALSDSMIEIVKEVPQIAIAEPVAETEVLPDATVMGPETVEIGRRFIATWEGPGDQWDRIALFDPRAGNGEGREVRGRRVQSDDIDRRQVELVAPVNLGTYELQYRYGPSGTVIATTEIGVVDAAVSIDAPANVEIGRSFAVGWVGPGGRQDRIQVIDTLANDGAGKVVTGKLLRNDDFDNRSVTLIAPAIPDFIGCSTGTGRTGQNWPPDRSRSLKRMSASQPRMSSRLQRISRSIGSVPGGGGIGSTSSIRRPRAGVARALAASASSMTISRTVASR